jgi:excisionase family DNA binding protein
MGRTKYYHVDEVAELIGVSANEVRDMLKRKELKGHKLGRRWLINMDQSYFDSIIRTELNGEKTKVSTFNQIQDKKYIFDTQAVKAMKFVDDGESLFITGKAGTGKTTLLKEILRRNEVGSKKNVVILAPTGVAAENAGGMTMHHFFQLPMKPYLPKHKIQPNLYKLD